MGSAAEYESVLFSEEASKRHGQEVSKTRQTLRCWALAAGIFYMTSIVCSRMARSGTRGSLIDYDSPMTTAHNIRKSPDIVRQCILIEVLLTSSDMVLTILLTFILLKAGADQILSVSTAGFRWMQLTVRVCNSISMFAVLLLLDKSMHPTMAVSPVIEFISTSDENLTAAEALSFFFLMLNAYGKLLALMFFGISLCLFGAVIVRHGVFPALFGWMLGVAGVCHLLDTLFYFFWTAYDGQMSTVLAAPAFIAELGIAGWLLFKTPTLANSFDA